MIDHEIDFINLIWNTFHVHFTKRLHNAVAIRLKNKRAQIAGSLNNLMWQFKTMRALVREKKNTSSQSCSFGLDEGNSLWEINCSLWKYHGCSNHLNLEMEAECLSKNLSYLNLNISRTKNCKTRCKKY